MSEPAHMWTYWRDKKGVAEALEFYYAERMEADPELRAALMQMKTAEAFIDQKMKDAADKEPYEL